MEFQKAEARLKRFIYSNPSLLEAFTDLAELKQPQVIH